jgi:RimJ/RimL family protein N-acetyltransferase
MDAPALSEDALLTAWRAGTLPPRFVATVGSRALWPAVAPGERLTLARVAPWPGAFAAVVSGARVAWRRVIAVRRGAALLRAEVAPFDDGWWHGLLGCADSPAAPWSALAARAPALATRAAWTGAVAWAEARRVLSRPRRGVAFSARILGPGDDAARAAMLLRARGGSAGGGAAALTVGLFADERSLVGEYQLYRDGPRGLSAGMVIEPSWRGRGGGATLARGLLTAARAVGLTAVTCAIAARNLPSVRAHLRAGYRDAGRWRRWPDDPLLAAERQWREFEATLR